MKKIFSLIPVFCFVSISQILFAQNHTPAGVLVAGGNGRGANANQLAQPNGVIADDDGNIWVADTHNSRIQFWAKGADSGVSIGAGLPNAPAVPTTLFLNRKGELYSTDYFAGRVVKFYPKHNKWKIVAGANHEIDLTRGLWVDVDENVYVADYGHNRVLKYAPGNCNGKVVAGGNGPGCRLNQLAHPVSVWVNSMGSIYVLDQDNNRVMKWKPGATRGIVVAGGNGAGSHANQIDGADYIFKDDEGNLLIADRNNNRIQKWAPYKHYGVTIAGGNGAGNALNQFDQPYGCFVDKRGFMYVADHENNRVLRFDLKDNNDEINCGYRDDLTEEKTINLGTAAIREDVLSSIAVYPNPASYEVNLSFYSEKPGNCMIAITDIAGKIALKKNIAAIAGINKVKADVSKCTKGVYIVSLVSADGEKKNITFEIQ